MFVIRFLAFPLMEFFAMKYLRKPFLETKNRLKSGWALFTAITALYYALLLYMSAFPTLITQRPDDIPALLLVLVLMPVTYAGIFMILRNQMRLLDTENREQILSVQTTSLKQRIDETSRLEEEIKIQRHDIRHRYSVLGEMLASDKKDEALNFIHETIQNFEQLKEVIYCENPVINAVLSHYIKMAHANGIKTDLQLSIPKEIELPETELSVVIANAFENAVNACLELPETQRFINCNALNTPQFMFKISNPVNGKIEFNENGLPKLTNKTDGHGTGIHSIVAFCEKYSADYKFDFKDNTFNFSMMK